MLRIHDPGTGRTEKVTAGRAVRMFTCGPCDTGPVHVGELRPYVLADVVRRLLESARVRVLAGQDSDRGPDAAALNLRPPELSLGDGEHAGLTPAHQLMGGLLDLRIDGHDPRPPGDDRQQGSAYVDHEQQTPAYGDGEQQVARHRVTVGPVVFGPASPSDPVALSDVAEAGLDPLAVRLAYLKHHYRDEVRLTWDLLREADRTVRHWRARVAAWAESPSAPLAAGHVERVRAALDDDLDTPSALRALRDLERDDAVAAGSKFESFLHLDQVLALDLSTDIGRR